MNRIIFLLIGAGFLAACQNPAKQAASGGNGTAVNNPEAVADTAEAAKFEFTETAFDFGTVDEGEKISHSYSFTNTGKSSLIISNAQASCGCTVPEWTKEPIPPGGAGEIKAVFDSKGRTGKQSKTITVYANTNPSVIHLQLTGEVRPNGE
ncbi:MAG TPA: DUF1573 domain-containing protein [Anseongella sp.]|nr:DUF1573 domain-containing protein [Anseongella sp.]